MKLVYINNGKSTVFDSQVLALLKYYTNNNFFEKVILLFGYKNQSEREWLSKKDTEGIVIYYYKTYPNYPFFNYLIQIDLLEALRTVSSDFSDFFFHIREEMTSYHFKKAISNINIKYDRLLTDVRGVSIQETEEFSISNKVLKALKLRNYRLAFGDLSNDLNISVVSKYFKKYMLSTNKFNKNSILINSCLVDESFRFDETERIKIRKELKIRNDEVLLIFTSGGTANWQNNDMIIKLADKGIKVLNLSKHEINYKNVITKFVDYREVPNYLSAADIAFIWRDKSIVNKVASPVKVSEYLACGLPIIHNCTVELINNVTNNGKDALCVKKLDDLTLSKIKMVIHKVNRYKLSKKGQSLFGLKNLAKSYQSIYLKKRNIIKEL